ncbi:hypothetical protein [Kingella potus]|uniref:hypothetical protein n=1 Tax=Kingella potus TaxID=265175 RepID=UPI0011C07CDC|nr:hypothetical protein [Kingella potus]
MKTQERPSENPAWAKPGRVFRRPLPFVRREGARASLCDTPYIVSARWVMWPSGQGMPPKRRTRFLQTAAFGAMENEAV